ncbi:hypothetical protein K435DRAFT_87230 [Dendrothele bispora CBS 962.96]|uniref:Lon N-terminal domain-containing protein n=1 Tax=Dendrothele bispora (strain CBS 962.96) TaxID=1314807 RepID=A0A4V4HB14_DENBC|nr:hypothetical protein K435DRAFT_87230 [Dendrothele bispora CBS 962.96]
MKQEVKNQIYEGSSGSNNNIIAKPSVPEVYPQVLALPIACRPLFPGFYKAVVIRNPHVDSEVSLPTPPSSPTPEKLESLESQEPAEVVPHAPVQVLGRRFDGCSRD